MVTTVLLGMSIAFVAFALSACAGLGGSLILVPAMILAFGTKHGIAIAAILLAFNNVGKVIAYRRTIPLRPVLLLIVLTALGAALGANTMLRFPTFYIDMAVIAMMIWVFLTEFHNTDNIARLSSSCLAFFSGCSSGFSGTSGPLKGLAIRKLNFDPLHFVGAASAISLAGDTTKVLLFINASLFDKNSLFLIVGCMLISPLAVYAGRQINVRLGTRLFASLFWVVMTGYTIRLVVNS